MALTDALTGHAARLHAVGSLQRLVGLRSGRRLDLKSLDAFDAQATKLKGSGILKPIAFSQVYSVWEYKPKCFCGLRRLRCRCRNK